MVVAALLGGAGDPLDAQVTGNWLTAGVGSERIDRRDRRISSARYSGIGTIVMVGYERWTRSTILNVSIATGGGELGSDQTGGSERVARGVVDVSLQRRVAPGLFAGLLLGARGDNTDHTYPRTPFSENFDVIVAGLSPVVTWLPRFRSRQAFLRASFAAITVVDREYSRSKSVNAPDDFEGPMRWSAGSLELGQTFRERQRVSWRLEAGANAWSHRVLDGATSLEMRASLTGRVRLGRVP